MNTQTKNLNIEELVAADTAHHFHPFTDHKTFHEAGGARMITHADGPWLWDGNGHKLFDAMAGLYAVAKRRQVNLWLGVRRDWRTGYDDDFVLRDTAHEEAKFAVAFGARFGALVIETVQRL